MQKIKIFLASSERLKDIREDFLKAMSAINDSYERYEITIKLVLWENLDSGVDIRGKQQFYEDELKKCDIVVLIYWGELGKFTNREYKLAKKLLALSGKPKIYIFKKNVKLPKRFPVSAENLKQLALLEKEIDHKTRPHFVFHFKNNDQALRKFESDFRTYLDSFIESNVRQVRFNTNRYDNLIKKIKLFGRSEEVNQLSLLLNDREISLITIIGAGGTGKSSLANHVAHENKQLFRNGAVFVELAPIREFGMIIPAIFGAMQDESLTLNGNAEEQLIAHLFNKQMIIILDNCEFLAADCAKIVNAVIGRCPGIKIIATSQVVLNAVHEKKLYLRTLDLSALESLNFESLQRDACVQLFLEHAVKADPKFKLSLRTIGDVVAICKLRAGIPLGIILAASALDIMSLLDIKLGIEFHLSNFDEHLYDNYAHHSSMDNAIAWSYDLLNQQQKDLFASLSIFRDDFTENAAVAVSGNPDNFNINFRRLVDASLLTRSSSRFLHSKTFFILEPLRQYAKEKLKHNEQRYHMHIRRLIAYYVELATVFSSKFFTAEQSRQLMLVEEQYHNIIEAISYLQKFGLPPQQGLLISKLWRFWEVKARFQEGITRLEEVLNMAGIDGETNLEILQGLGTLYYRGGNIPNAVSYFEQHLAASRKFESDNFGKIHIAHAFNNMANEKTVSDGQGAEELLNQAYQLFNEFGDKRMVAVTRNNLGNIYRATMNLVRAGEYYQESIASFEAEGNYWESGFPLFGLGCVYFESGNYPAAQKTFDKAYERRKEVGDKRNMGRCSYYFALLALKRKETEKAYAFLKESFLMLQQVKDLISLCELHLAIMQYCYAAGFFEITVNIYHYVIRNENAPLSRTPYLKQVCEEIMIAIQSQVNYSEFQQWIDEARFTDMDDIFFRIDHRQA